MPIQMIGSVGATGLRANRGATDAPAAPALKAPEPHADAAGKFTIFNVGGNKYRLATIINYRTGKVFVRHVLTHDEYGGRDWTKQ